MMNFFKCFGLREPPTTTPQEIPIPSVEERVWIFIFLDLYIVEIYLCYLNIFDIYQVENFRANILNCGKQ